MNLVLGFVFKGFYSRLIGMSVRVQDLMVVVYALMFSVCAFGFRGRSFGCIYIIRLMSYGCVGLVL